MGLARLRRHPCRRRERSRGGNAGSLTAPTSTGTPRTLASLGTEPQGDAAHWFLASHAQELGWGKYVHGGHVWWYHAALGIWFWEQSGET